MDTSSNSDPVGKQPQPQIPNSLAKPLLDSAGKFADDPFWDEMLDSIRRQRRELDAAWNNVQ